MKRFIYLMLVMVMMGLTSCLKYGLEELPAFEDADITDFYFEYRYTITQNLTRIGFQRLTNVSKTISDQSVNITVSVPAASGTFTEAERAKVNLNNIVGYCYLSTAATITPIDGAPTLGKSGNFSSPVKYKVTAANGKTSKIYTITVTMQ